MLTWIIVIIISVGSLLSLHIYLLYIRKTTYEYLFKKKNDNNNNNNNESNCSYYCNYNKFIHKTRLYPMWKTLYNNKNKNVNNEIYSLTNNNKNNNSLNERTNTDNNINNNKEENNIENKKIDI